MGEYDNTSTGKEFLGSPGHFYTTVLATPQVNTDSSAYYFTTGQKDINKIYAENLRLSIYPNPINNNQELTVHYYVAAQTQISLELYDNSGKLIDQKTLATAGRNIGEQKFNTAPLTNGIYFIRLKTDSENTTQRFIINR
ncbi:MAG: T9SS type A sorting domain-containing protein [Bacteroidia bacterium]|nr:T9SS type A sorting domain-containing protein [Bacteroidia bacterium]